MALYYNPTVAQNGLVFCYDVNSSRSWKGKPVTNLMPYPEASYNYTTNAMVFGYNTDTVGGQTKTFLYGYDNPVGASGVFNNYTGTTGYKFFTIDTSTIATAGTYTYSYYAKSISGPTNLNLQQLWRDSLIGDQAVSGDWNPTYSTSWTRYATTGPVSTNAVLQYFVNHSGSLTGGATVYYCGFQMETGSFASPWVNGSRTNTQALLDLSSNQNTITANSLTYAAGNTFSFNGTSDYLSLPAGQNYYSGGFTCEAIVKFTSASQTWERIIDFSSGTPSDNIIFSRSGNSNDLRLQIFNGSTSVADISATGAIANGSYAHYAVTANGTNLYIYKNGIQVATVASSGLPSNVSRTTNYIGRSPWSGDSYFSGNIDMVRTYSRALSAAEINANYRSIAAKYGI
jgi:hypothetical protein